MIRISRLMAGLSIAALVGAVVQGCGGTQTASRPMTPRMSGRSQERGPSRTQPGGVAISLPEHLTQLGITGQANSGRPMGLLVTGFLPSSEPCALQLMGVEEGDVVVSCNGQAQQIAGRVVLAVRSLQEEGEPLTLVVIRQGKQITLQRTEKLPEGSLPSTDSE